MSIEKVLPKTHPLYYQKDKFTRLPGTELFSGVVTITPAIAQECLDKWNYTRNRKISEATVNDLTWAILNGAYVLNGEPFIFSDKGEGLDFQHRCMSTIRAGVSIEQLVTVGLPEAVISSIDNEQSRSAVQQFKILYDVPENLSAKDVTSLASFGIEYESWLHEMRTSVSESAQVYKRIRKRGPLSQKAYFTHEDQWLRLNPDWEENLSYIFNPDDTPLVGRKGLWRINAQILTGSYHMIAKHDRDLAKVFYDSLRFALKNPMSQENSESLSDPKMKTAYRFAQWAAPSVGIQKYGRKPQLRQLTSAFNKFAEGEYAWKPTGHPTTDFPIFSVIDLL